MRKSEKLVFLRKHWLLALVIALALGVNLFIPERGEVLNQTIWHYLVEMLSFIPPVFVLTALLDVWVPRRIVEGNIGPGTGVKGIIITIITATSAAGPLYVAFPIALTLYRKGAKVSNVVLFLHAWGTIKIPMVLNEIRFVGFDFAIARLLLTLPAIIAISLVVEKIIKVIEPAPGMLED